VKTELRDIDAILESFQRSSATDILLTTPQFELRASKRKEAARIELRGIELRGNVSPSNQTQIKTPASQTPAPAVPSQVRQTTTQKVMTEPPEGHVFVRAANLGTFYRAPKPGAPEYVNVGDSVTPEAEICLIEVMKLFTPLHAGVSGVVREILVNDSSLVEFDQPLFLIELRD
jgi:acetyl-CoA carboxylase biotin carboxyl carrier protein